MAVATHPSPETLAAFARGDLPAAELAAVAEHIGACGTCCGVVARVPDDTLGNLARAAGGPVSSATPTVGLPADAGEIAGGSIPAPLADHPRYRIIRELGAGGMGVVYKAEHRIMGRVVALKVMAPHLTAKAGAVERFRKEVRAAAQLAHENIVTAHDADEAGGLHFLVMEYVEGASLDRLVAKKGPLAVPLACSFTRQAALGLQHAHGKGMVHRDIKPQNLMVTRKAKVKVMDFGLARFVGADEEEAPAGRLPFGAARPVADPVTNPNLLMGTPDYLSPEQAKNSHNVDSRSDLYSLGCTLFFLLTGKSPFAHAESLIDKLLAHTREQPPPIRGLRPDVPEGLAAVLERMLAKNPDERFETAVDVANALLPFTRGGGGDEGRAAFEVIDAALVAPATPVAAHPTAVPPVTPAAIPLPLPPAGPAAAAGFDGPTLAEAPRPRRGKKSRRSRRRPWWQRTPVVLGAVAAAVLAAIALGLAAGKKKEAEPPPTAAVTPEKPAPAPKGEGGGTGTGPARPGTGGASPADASRLPLLYVLPSEGLYGPDYFSVTRELNSRGVKVVTASGKGTTSPTQEPGRVIKLDKVLTAVAPADYAGIIFCGRDVEEYLPGGPEGDTTRKLLDGFRKGNKVVASVCTGQRVLVEHGLLDGKLAAWSEHLDKYSGQFQRHRVGRSAERVVPAQGKILTASGDRDAPQFAAMLAKAVGGK